MATVHSCVFPPNLATVAQLDQDHYHLPPSLSPLEPLPPPSPLPWQHAVRLGKGFIAVSCVTGGTLVRTTEEEGGFGGTHCRCPRPRDLHRHLHCSSNATLCSCSSRAAHTALYHIAMHILHCSSSSSSNATLCGFHLLQLHFTSYATSLTAHTALLYHNPMHILYNTVPCCTALYYIKTAHCTVLLYHTALY